MPRFKMAALLLHEQIVDADDAEEAGAFFARFNPADMPVVEIGPSQLFVETKPDSDEWVIPPAATQPALFDVEARLDCIGRIPVSCPCLDAEACPQRSVRYTSELQGRLTCGPLRRNAV